MKNLKIKKCSSLNNKNYKGLKLSAKCLLEISYFMKLTLKSLKNCTTGLQKNKINTRN